MSNDTADRPDNSTARALERHLQSGLLAIVGSITGWLGFTVQDSTVQMARLTERLAGLERQIAITQEQTYTAKDASKDLQLRDAVIANVAARVLTLEGYHRK